MDIPRYIKETGERARAAAREMARADGERKNRALSGIATLLTESEAQLLEANAEDLKAGGDDGLNAALLDRLELTPARVKAMSDGLRQVAALPDPVGATSPFEKMPSGIKVAKMRAPLGVVAIIYESRPNVTADAAALCLKSGNAVILRGGSEAIHSNRSIATRVRDGLRAGGLPEDAVQLVDTTDRDAVGELLKSADVDVIIPRGGKGLIERVAREARMPVIKHLDGICHVYIDDDADLGKAVRIAYNAKTQRYGTCNTMECLLIAESIAARALAELAPLYQTAGVEIRGCEQSRGLCAEIKAATEEDYHTEHLAPVLSLRIVDGLEAALEHIRIYGSNHTDAIVTENREHADRFLREVDSSSVMVNVSTRFADGFEYGLGAEIGISTDKFHARGPVGLEGLTSQKYVVVGDGQIRE